MSKLSTDPSVYNEMYLQDDRTYDDPEKSPYMPMYRAVMAEVSQRKIPRVLEVGCGSGTLAAMLIEGLGISYSGFDIAEEGVKKARIRNPGGGSFAVGDATDQSAYQYAYDGVVCVEVLEHIPDDRKVIEQWAPGVQCICSVPNFDYPTHVRKFSREEDVISRYGDLIDIERIVRVRKRIWAGGMTLKDYLRRLRWNRNNLRYVVGMLGINSFDNYAGWFLFSGRRLPKLEAMNQASR